jgi:hypothetical protein
MQEVKNDKKQEKKQYGQSNDREEGLMREEFNGKEVPKVDLPEKSQIYLVELLFIYSLVITSDVVDVLSVTGIGIPVAWTVSGLATGITTLWLIWKGRRAEWILVANIIDLIPLLSILPIKTATLTFLLLSEKSKKLQKVMEVAQKTPINKDKK